jgi:DNA-binding NarL/FixJ family response regulator
VKVEGMVIVTASTESLTRVGPVGAGDLVHAGGFFEQSQALVDRSTRAVDVDLTPREWEIVKCLSRGRTNTEIADELGIAPSTVKSHLASMYRKLGVSNRTQAAVAFSLRRPTGQAH